MIEQIRLNERASLSRPAWTSEHKTGMFHAYRHLHIGRKNCPVVWDYYKRSKGTV